GRVRTLIASRVDKAFAEYDGIRVDHPHGLVCPWVYSDDVQAGARLFESPDRPDLAPYAIARAEQIDHSKPRYDDHWVRGLDVEQNDRYSTLFDLIVGEDREIICEVLSTLPAPLAGVLSRYGLGRWRVTQKANLDDPADVYRVEHAEPQ